MLVGAPPSRGDIASPPPFISVPISTIPPLSRNHHVPSSPRIVTAAARVWQRHAAVGALFGFLLSFAALGGHHEVGLEGEALYKSTLLSAIFSSVCFGLFSGFIGSATWALFLCHPRLAKHARRAAALAGSASVAVYLLLRGTGELFRLVNDAPFNLGTWEFVIEGLGPLAFSLLAEYTGLVLGLVVPVLLCAGASYFALARSTREVVDGSALAARAVGSLACLALLVHTLLTPKMTAEGGLGRTADLSFLASVGVRLAENAAMEKELAEGKTVVPRGARVSDGVVWDAAARHLPGPRPNVLLILLESVGVNHLGYEGYSRPLTPHLDRLAESSLNFRQARSTATHSNYAQMAVLSSLFPRRYTGLDTYRRLDYPRVLWHDFLGTLGYTTVTHSSQDETWQGMLRFQQTGSPTEFYHAGTYEGRRIQMGSERVVPDEVTATRLMEWIGLQKKSWAAYVNFQSTHFPYKVPEGAQRRFLPDVPTRGKFHYLKYPERDRQIAINRYDNALRYVDAQIGRIVEYLRKNSALDNTLIVITSDHGELFFDHGMVTHGRSLFDKELRVPLLIHYPSSLGSEEVLEPVSTLDVLPTVAEILEVPAHPAFQGSSLLQRDPHGRRPLFMNIQGMKSQDAVICGRLKLIDDRSGQRLQLYDLQSDPEEGHNLIHELPAEGARMEALLRSQMNAQMRYYSPNEPDIREAFYAPGFADCPGDSGFEQVLLSQGRKPRLVSN